MQKQPKRYRVGIVGFGFIGKVHAYGYHVMPYYYEEASRVRAKVTRVCTGHAETAERAAALVGAEKACTDYREITETPEIDIVHICTPNRLHREVLLSAIAHGKHIYCDKPLVATAEEADQVRRVLPGYRGIGQMTFQIRFFPAMLRARQLISEGFLGKPLEVRCVFLHGGSADPQAPLKWKLSAAAGGGVIADLGSHVLDLVDTLVGPIDRVFSATHTAFSERPDPRDPTRSLPVDAEDSVQALVRLQSGALGTLGATKLATGAEDELRLEIHGTRGAIRYNQMDPHHLEVYDATVSDRPLGGRRGWTRIDTGQRYPAPALAWPGAKLSVGWLRSHVACLAAFLAAIREGRPADPGLEQGVRVQYLMDALRRSAAEQRWISPRHGNAGTH